MALPGRAQARSAFAVARAQARSAFAVARAPLAAAVAFVLSAGPACGAAAALALLAGCGDDTVETTTTSASGVGGAGGGGGAGGAGGEPLVNGCDRVTAQDQTGAVVPLDIETIVLAYSPRCARVLTGTVVTITSDFATHPLVGGLVEGGMLVPEPGSPIPSTSEGSSVSFSLPVKGTFGYYCENHGLAGMNGAIFVE